MVLRRSPLELDAAEVSASIGPVLSRWPVRRAWLFGSVARGEQRAGSDVDIMVELDEGASLGFASSLWRMRLPTAWAALPTL